MQSTRPGNVPTTVLVGFERPCNTDRSSADAGVRINADRPSTLRRRPPPRLPQGGDAFAVHLAGAAQGHALVEEARCRLWKVSPITHTAPCRGR